MLNNSITNVQFKHYSLQLIYPDFTSPLTDLIIELDYLRKKLLAENGKRQKICYAF